MSTGLAGKNSLADDYRNKFSLGRMKGMINDLNIGSVQNANIYIGAGG